MLLHLKIRDFAIIDRVELELPPGFTVITGETGAGKSILVDALVVALGGRAQSELVREGAPCAEVEALFDISQHPLVRARLEQRDLCGDDPDVLLVRRVLGPKGKAKVLVNGHLSTIATLAEIVRGLVDISGQHEQLSLLAVDRHLEILDACGELDELRGRFGAAYASLREALRERDALRQGEEAQRRADFIRFQLEEIERLAPRAGEDTELEAERRRLAHAEKLRQGALVADALLYGDDGSAFDKLGKAAAEVEALVRIDPEIGGTLESLASARRDIEEAARVLQRYGDRIEADPARLDAVDERLSAIARLCRKHGGSLVEVLARREVLAKEIDGLDNVDARLAELEGKVTALGGEALALARELSAARQQAAAKLDAAIVREVADMELAGASFITRLGARAAAAGDDAVIDGQALGPSGLDEVEFLWSANRGEAARSLARIVSGGELSRLMLAVKRVLAARDLVSLYVFDEVDTGLGGKAADAIGKKLQSVAKNHQAITITHLAPIAARADHHLRVTKDVRGDRTVSAIALVEGSERAEEVARMIDGARSGKAALEAARAMLARGQKGAP